MDEILRELVRQRAGNRCEYCLLPQEVSLLNFHVDHIIARQHLDDVIDTPETLCLACHRCNAHKGTNLSSIDPLTATRVALYDPRNDSWLEHFQISGGRILGLTPKGRATVRLLNMNAPQRVELREQWIENGGTF